MPLQAFSCLPRAHFLSSQKPLLVNFHQDLMQSPSPVKVLLPLLMQTQCGAALGCSRWLLWVETHPGAPWLSQDLWEPQLSAPALLHPSKCSLDGNSSSRALLLLLLEALWAGERKLGVERSWL